MNEEKKIERLRTVRDAAFRTMSVARDAHKRASSAYSRARKRHEEALAALNDYRKELGL